MPPIITFLFYGMIPALGVYISQFHPHLMPSIESSTAWFFFFSVLANSGHVFFTLAPFAQRASSTPLGVRAFYIWPTIALALSLSFALISRQAFAYMIAYATMIHVLRQHVGIFIKTARKEASGADLKVHHTITWIIIFFSLLHWHSYASEMTMTYFTPNDLLRFLPAEPFNTTGRLAPILFALYLFSFIRYPIFKRNFPYRIFTLQCGVFIWYFAGLVIYAHTSLYWMLTTILHGHVYIYYVIRDQKLIHEENKISGWQRHLNYLIPLLLILVLWELSKSKVVPWSTQNSLLGGVFLALLWSPALLHYILDAILWSSKIDTAHKKPIAFNGIIKN